MPSIFLRWACILPLGLIFFSCAHNTSQRQPSSAAMQNVFSCGYLDYSESNREARDSDDVFYNLQLDCNKDKKVDADQMIKVVSFSPDQLTRSQKGWVTRWTNQARAESKKITAYPYLCIQYQAAVDPCVRGESVLGYFPRFTSKGKN